MASTYHSLPLKYPSSSRLVRLIYPKNRYGNKEERKGIQCRREEKKLGQLGKETRKEKIGTV